MRRHRRLACYLHTAIGCVFSHLVTPRAIVMKRWHMEQFIEAQTAESGDNPLKKLQFLIEGAESYLMLAMDNLLQAQHILEDIKVTTADEKAYMSNLKDRLEGLISRCSNVTAVKTPGRSSCVIPTTHQVYTYYSRNLTNQIKKVTG